MGDVDQGGAPQATSSDPGMQAPQPAAGDGQGAGSQSAEPQYKPWTQNIPKDLVRPEMAEFDSFGDYLKSVYTTQEELNQKLQGYDGAVKPLAEGATDQEIAEYRKAMGLPDDPGAYTFEGYTEDFAKEFAEFAHKNLLSPQQAEAILKYNEQRIQDYQQKQAEEFNKTRDATIQQIKQKYPNDYQQRIDGTNATLKRFFGVEGMKEIRESGLGVKDWFVNGMIDMAKSFTDGSLNPDGNSGGGSDGNSPQALARRLYPEMAAMLGRK